MGGCAGQRAAGAQAGIAAAALGLVFARRRAFRTFLRRELWLRFLLMGVLDGGSLLAYFYAIRETGVAVATFLLFVQPVGWLCLRRAC